jgi:hypothetical protein
MCECSTILSSHVPVDRALLTTFVSWVRKVGVSVAAWTSEVDLSCRDRTDVEQVRVMHDPFCLLLVPLWNHIS